MHYNATIRRFPGMKSRISGALLLVFMAAIPFLANAQSPTAPALNFNIFLHENAEMGYSESEGPTAIGGDLSLINSGHAFAIHSGGTFEVDGMKISLLVGGKVNYLAGNSNNVKNGYVKIGVQNGSVAWYTNEQGTGYPPVRITPSASYNGNPRFELLDIKADQYSPELSASNKPVFQSGLIDFDAAFTQLKANSTSLSSCTDNAYLTESNGTLIPGRTNLPAQVKITLNNGINVLNISGTEINKLSEISFNNTPSASRVLIVNVNAPGSFAWNVFNSAGSFGGLTGCQYILYNFYNTTSLTIQGNGAVEGTVFAPFAAVNKKNNNSNIEGQLIAKSFKQEAGGEIHYAIFQPSTAGCGTPPVPTDASFTINNDAQCKAGNNFVFTNSSTGDAPLSYQWTFGDGGTSTSANPSHSYAASGAYTVKLVVTAAGGKDSVSKTVNVWTMPAAGFTVNNNEQALSGNSFEFTTSNHVSGNTYQWWFGDGGTSSVQNPVHSYTATGTYTVKQVVNSDKGCSDTTTLIVKVKTNPTTASFTINNDAQCLSGNSFVFTSSVSGDGPFTYQWAFGDGGTSADSEPVYTYSAAGTYTVTLIVNGTGGADTATDNVTVTASPAAGFTVNQENQELTGNSFVFTTIDPDGADNYHWSFGDNTFSSDVNPVKSYDSAGLYQVVQIVSAISGCSDTFMKQVVVICDSVSSGNDGGIESESLGGLVNRRDFLRIRNSVDSRINYAALPVFAAHAPYATARRTKGSLELNGMIPQQLAEGDAVYITSPTDLLSITKAVDVLSVDYTRNQKAKAVVLGIKTLDKAYSHTKSICDRFRGSELLFVDTVSIRGFDFTRFAMKRDGGIVEYALAFVIGKDTRRNNYTLQTNWLISEYAPDEEVYNFQVWSANPQDAVKLAGDVLDNLNLDQSVEQINRVRLPKAYITYGMRDKANLVIRIENTAAQADARIVFEERANEDGDVKLIEFPVTLKPGRENVFELPIRDGYEYQGRVYMNDVLEDEVYMADGNWGIDYDSDNTTVHQFTRGNNPERVYHDNEYPLYRNVTLKAKNRSYISVYKAIRSGTEKADLTAYHSVKFFAKGTGRVEIRLTRDSIVDWKSQYKTEISLDESGKEYAISFDDFYSDRIDEAFNPRDIKTIVFTFITANGKEEDVDFHISGVSFSPEQVLSKRGLDSRTMEIAPNPNNGRFECFFNSEEERTLDFTITDVTGRVVFARTVNAVAGVNSVSVDLNTPGGSVLMISLKGKDLFYDAKKLIIK